MGANERGDDTSTHSAVEWVCGEREEEKAERRAQHSQPVVYGLGWGEAEDLNKRGMEIGGRYSSMCRGRRKGGGAVSVGATSKRSMTHKPAWDRVVGARESVPRNCMATSTARGTRDNQLVHHLCDEDIGKWLSPYSKSSKGGLQDQTILR